MILSKRKGWLSVLPQFVSDIARQYNLSNLLPITNLTYHYVMSGFQEEKPIILKLGFDTIGLRREASALRAFSGFGVVSVLVEDEGMLLLERAVPGDSLKAYFPERDDEAIAIAATLMQRLHQAIPPKPGVLPHIKEWLTALDCCTPHIVGDEEKFISYFHKARYLKAQLLQTCTKEALLHGDLHHDNILQNGNKWVIIDPKGVIGDPVYDVGAFIRNPIPELLELTEVINLIERRVTIFARLFDVSTNRILNWCFVQAVLAWFGL